MSEVGKAASWLVRTADGFRWRRDGDGVLAEWGGVLTLRVNEHGQPTHEPAPGADARLVEKVLATGAAAFVRALRGQPSLHGSAVARSGVALVFLGDKGAGKSTAASELCERHGFELLADDVAALDDSTGRWRVLPTESSHWLDVEGQARKGPIAAPHAGRHAASPAALVSLRFDDEAPVGRALPLRGAAAYSTLATAFLRFEAADALRVRELDVLASLAAQVPTYEVTRSRAVGPKETALVLVKLLESLP